MMIPFTDERTEAWSMSVACWGYWVGGYELALSPVVTLRACVLRRVQDCTEEALA